MEPAKPAAAPTPQVSFENTAIVEIAAEKIPLRVYGVDGKPRPLALCDATVECPDGGVRVSEEEIRKVMEDAAAREEANQLMFDRLATESTKQRVELDRIMGTQQDRLLQKRLEKALDAKQSAEHEIEKIRRALRRPTLEDCVDIAGESYDAWSTALTSALAGIGINDLAIAMKAELQPSTADAAVKLLINATLQAGATSATLRDCRTTVGDSAHINPILAVVLMVVSCICILFVLSPLGLLAHDLCFRREHGQRVHTVDAERKTE